MSHDQLGHPHPCFQFQWLAELRPELIQIPSWIPSFWFCFSSLRNLEKKENRFQMGPTNQIFGWPKFPNKTQLLKDTAAGYFASARPASMTRLPSGKNRATAWFCFPASLNPQSHLYLCKALLQNSCIPKTSQKTILLVDFLFKTSKNSMPHHFDKRGRPPTL